MFVNYLPHTADIDGNVLIFYDQYFALARCEIHPDQDPDSDVPDTVALWPDDWEADHHFVRLKPETLRIFPKGVFPDRGAEQIYFNSDASQQSILEDFPALKAEAERRAYLDALDRWEKDCSRIFEINPDVSNDELPPHPVFELARVEWQTWQDALAERDALRNELDLNPEIRKQGRPAMNAAECAAVDIISAKIDQSAKIYRRQVPVNKIEPSSADELRRQNIHGTPENALIGQTALALAALAAEQIDHFNDGWPIERWPDAPQLPPNLEESYPAIFRQLNFAIRRIVTMAQKPRTFRVDRMAHILAIVAHVHPDTCSELVNLIREKRCSLPDTALVAAHKKFENALVWEVQGRNRSTFIAAREKPDPQNSDNVRIYLSLSGHELRFDDFTQQMEVSDNGYDWRNLDEDYIAKLWLDARSINYNFAVARDFFRTAIENIAKDYRYDSLRYAVNSLKWDKVERLNRWLAKSVGCPDDSYHRAVGINLIGGLIKRAREPGAKHDETVILISPEGSSKSSFCEALALRPDWFTDSVQVGGRPQDVIPQLKGKQLIELAELDGLSRAETNNVKAFMSRRNDQATLKYEREAREHHRRHIFVGTTNEESPLISQTGNRRWLPVHVTGRIDVEWVRENIEQLYAEAAEWHASGEEFGIPEALWNAAGQHQEAARERTGAEDVLGFAFGDAKDCYVTAADIQLFASERRLPLKDLRGALKRLGFENVAQRDGDDVRKVWRRGHSGTAVRFKPETYANGPCELRPPAIALALPPLPPPPQARA